MTLNVGEANAVLLLHDLLSGTERAQTAGRKQEYVVDALQLLVEAAVKRLQLSRPPVEVRDAAVRLHELVTGVRERWGVEFDGDLVAHPTWTEDDARDWASAEDTAVVKRRFASEWVDA